MPAKKTSSEIKPVEEPVVTETEETPKAKKGTKIRERKVADPNTLLRLELMKADVITANNIKYPHRAISEMFKRIRLTASIPMLRENEKFNSRDVYYLRKDNNLKFDEKTGILYAEVPRTLINQAPGYTAIPKVYVNRAITKTKPGAKKTREGWVDVIREITDFTLVEVSLAKGQENAFPGLKSKLE